MIVVDTGVLVALFNPKDKMHKLCANKLKSITEDLYTTVPILTETFHLLCPGSKAVDNCMEFIIRGGVNIWFMDNNALLRAYELITKYADHPMDLADASILVALEDLKTSKVFTVDHNDFYTYRFNKWYHNCPIT
ncbi:MAG: PIN domain-containing protein, partial [Gammaproteobacteria bacterium]|nr:PIN domain-containing protein [Gammaproteobacteria bacterium]